MKIESSSIAMSSTHTYSSYTQVEHLSMTGKADALEGVVLTLSKVAEGESYKEALADYEKQQKEAREEQKQNPPPLSIVEASKMEAIDLEELGVSDEFELKLELLKRMFQLMSERCGVKFYDLSGKGLMGSNLRSNMIKLSGGEEATEEAGMTQSAAVSNASRNNPAIGNNNTSVWTKISATSANVKEYENTTFASKGIVQTSDGRTIDFDVSFSMSRAFEACINTLEVSNYMVTDPLVINMDTNMTSISEQKFFFDIDSDGEEEEMSFVGKGSGFLALDKNGDGVINDGSELFGTKSGDGFKDLAAYNEDGNNWIDENDSIFYKLKIWTKDENGNDVLVSLKDADVGAIYLGNAETEFQYKNDEYKTDAILRKTGVYLKESSGQVGTVSHVDLAI